MLKPTLFRLSRRAAIVGGASLAMPHIARAATTRWVLYTVRLRDSAGAREWQAMADRIKQATNGALEITVVTAGRLGIDANAISAGVSSGAIALGDDSYFGQLVVGGGVARLPMIVPDVLHLRRGTKAMKTYLTANYAPRGVTFLAYTFTPKLRTFSRLPCDSFAGLLNRRIRTTSAEQGDFVRRLGAVPVTLPTADIPRALKAGDVDTVFTFGSTGGTAWRPLLKQGYAGGPHHLDAVLIANTAMFQALPRSMQEIVIAEAARSEAALIEALYAREDEALRKLEGDGLSLNELQGEDINVITLKMGTMWEDWARVRGPEARDLLFAFRRAMEEQ